MYQSSTNHSQIRTTILPNPNKLLTEAHLTIDEARWIIKQLSKINHSLSHYLWIELLATICSLTCYQETLHPMPLNPWHFCLGHIIREVEI